MSLTNEKTHYSTVISSLNKQYNQSKLGKTFSPNDIYLLNIIYKILNEDIIEVTSDETKVLSSLYRNLMSKSKNICYTNNTCNVYSSFKSKTIQADNANCVSIPGSSNNQIIEYWQENSVSNTITDIINNINDRVTQQATYDAFENGIIISYTNIGRICFLLREESFLNYSIYGELNSDVTDLFDKQYISDLNAVIFVSKNIYSYGNVKIKIIKN